MKRYLNKYILNDLTRKMTIITGPRQAGKTTLSKQLKASFDYLNYDQVTHRKIMNEQSWDRKKELIIFDEVHKMNNWKLWLKGIYDTEIPRPNLVVTGSAKMNTFKRVGESLAGRYFHYRLHPIDIKEAKQILGINHEQAYERLVRFSGFPEPFLQTSDVFYNRWKRTHIDSIIKEDLRDLTAVRDVKSIELLIELLRDRVGSPISYSSLAQDIQKSPKTIKSWIELLENLYVIFRVTPFHKNIARSILKEPKIYFFDTAMPKGDEGLVLENIVACSLFKEVHFQQDCLGKSFNLHYLRNKQGNEVDFLITLDNQAHTLIEVKLSDNSLSKGLNQFLKDKKLNRLQLVQKCQREKTFPSGEEIRQASKYLESLPCFESQNMLDINTQ